MKTKRFLIIDYETFSEADLKKAGAWEYSMHPSTTILSAAFRLGTKEELKTAKTKIWIPGIASESFSILLKAFLDPDVDLVARNASFEIFITLNVFAKKFMPSKPQLQLIPLERWHCTAAMSRSIGLPGSLEGSGAALNTIVQKDKEGHRIMLKLSKPRKPTKNDPSTRHSDPEDFKKLYSYNIQDVDTDCEIFLKLPELHPQEREFWLLNQRMNMRGFAVDRELVSKALELVALETKRLNKRIWFLTNRKVETGKQTAKLLKYLNRHGLELPNLRALTIKDLLKKGVKNKRLEEILKIRAAISKSSTAKFAAFLIRSGDAGRARDNTLFFGASTGRESGRGLQPQNLFVPTIDQKDVELGIELIKRRDLGTIQAIYDSPMELFASVLRSCIVADNGKTLDVGDFATIEVRVLFWLAGHQKGLDALASGRDLYCEMASRIYNINAEKLLKLYKAGDKDAKFKRQLGKQTVLGAGFGIGVGGEKFLKTALQYGMNISLELAQTAVRAYRELHPRIPIFWTNMERAAILATQNPGKRYKVGYLIWERSGDFLTCQLPMGRKLHYFKPRLTMKKGPWGESVQLSYMGVLSPSKKFGRIGIWGGTLVQHATQAVARDCLKFALLRLEKKGKSLPVLEVHDEIGCERKIGEGSLEDFIATMSEVPSWAKGLPIKVEAWSEPRYRK